VSTDATQTQMIAARYADAFFDLAETQNAIETCESDLNNLKTVLHDHEELRSFIKSPVYNAEDQQKVVENLAEKAGFSPLTRNFLNLITSNRRLFALDAIIDAFTQRLSTHRGEVNAQAVTAIALNQDQERRLRSEIETVVGKAVNLETRIDPELLGGMIVKVGSTMIDSSLKTKLNRLQSVMKEA